MEFLGIKGILRKKVLTFLGMGKGVEKVFVEGVLTLGQGVKGSAAIYLAHGVNGAL